MRFIKKVIEAITHRLRHLKLGGGKKFELEDIAIFYCSRTLTNFKKPDVVSNRKGKMYTIILCGCNDSHFFLNLKNNE